MRRRLPVLESSAQVVCERLHATLPLSSCVQRYELAHGTVLVRRGYGTQASEARRLIACRGCAVGAEREKVAA